MYQLLLWLIPTIEKFPRSQKFTLGNRIEGAALDTLDHLIAATFTRARRGHLDAANLNLERLRVLLRLANELRILDHRRYEHAARLIDGTGRLVGAWRKAQIAGEAAREQEAAERDGE